MALSGQLSDLSLAELIEFFCNQRKTGRLKIAYQQGPGFFYFDRGELVDAKIGGLTGVEAVYYSLTLENASFKFSTAFEATQRTIHQPWANVALEGLRRLDEGIMQKGAFVEGAAPVRDEETDEEEEEAHSRKAVKPEQSPPLSLMVEGSKQRGRKSTLTYAAVIAALLLSVAAIGFPAGWYGKRKAAANAQAAPAAASSSSIPEVKPESTATSEGESGQAEASAAQTESEAGPLANTSSANSFAVRQQQEREREARAAYLAAQERAGNAQAAAKQNGAAQSTQPQAMLPEMKKPEAANPAQQKRSVTVQVTYDENGRVTQASGGDGMAQRIARQKRFPAGKGGTTTVTIPVN